MCADAWAAMRAHMCAEMRAGIYLRAGVCADCQAQHTAAGHGCALAVSCHNYIRHNYIGHNYNLARLRPRRLMP